MGSPQAAQFFRQWTGLTAKCSGADVSMQAKMNHDIISAPCLSRDSSILGEAISMNLESKIKGALKKQVSLPMLREIVCQYKQNGGTQQAAYVILEKIRHEQIEEPDEDRILELMDFVAGFCAQDQRIWDEILVG